MVPVVLGSVTTVSRGKLLAWTALVGTLASLAYAGNFLVDQEDTGRDLLYEWSSAVAGLVQYAIVGGVVLLISRGLAPEVLGLRRPTSWKRAAGLTVLALVAIWVIGIALNPFLDAGDEQGIVPDGWDGSRAAPFVANFVVVAVVAPIVEELTFRGLGFAAIRDAHGVTAAVLLSGLAFGLAHGLLIALPVLAILGVILAVLRLKTDSIYPTMIAHGVFNATALIAAVTLGG